MLKKQIIKFKDTFRLIRYKDILLYLLITFSAIADYEIGNVFSFLFNLFVMFIYFQYVKRIRGE